MAPPRIVDQALDLAGELSFARSCSPEVGRVLQLLVALNPEGQFAEIGTGCGVGTAWMASALREGGVIYSIDNNAEQKERVSQLFADRVNIHIVHGDWREILCFGPFNILFVDVSEPKQAMPSMVLQAVAPHGALVVDDLTPRIGAEFGQHLTPRSGLPGLADASHPSIAA